MRRLRFSLRSLLVFITLFAIACGSVMHRIHAVQKARETILAVNGMAIILEPERSSWLSRLGIGELEQRIVGIGLGKQQRWNVGGWSHIEVFDPTWGATPLLELQMEALGGYLGVFHCEPCCANDETLAKLSEIGNQVQMLNLGSPRFSDATIKLLPRQFPNLEYLVLNDSVITDVGLMELPKLVALQSLDLVQTATSDVGLREIERLPNLKLLNVAGTQVTQVGIDRIKAVLPNLKVWWNGDLDN